jgi:hypothetical protein
VQNREFAHENSTVKLPHQSRMRQSPKPNVQNLQFAHEKQLPKIPKERTISRKVQIFKFDDQKHITQNAKAQDLSLKTFTPNNERAISRKVQNSRFDDQKRITQNTKTQDPAPNVEKTFIGTQKNSRQG